MEPGRNLKFRFSLLTVALIIEKNWIIDQSWKLWIFRRTTIKKMSLLSHLSFLFLFVFVHTDEMLVDT